MTTVELVSITGRQSTSSGEWVTGGNTSQGYLEHRLEKMAGRVEGLQTESRNQQRGGS